MYAAQRDAAYELSKVHGSDACSRRGDEAEAKERGGASTQATIRIGERVAEVSISQGIPNRKRERFVIVI